MIMSMSFNKSIYCFGFQFVHAVFIAVSTPLQQVFDLSRCNYREEFCKEEVTGKEQPKRSHIKTNFPNCWPIICAPWRRQVFTVNGCDNNYKPFEPHSNIHQD